MTLSYTGVRFGGIVSGDALTVSASGAFVDANASDTPKKYPRTKVNISNLTLGGVFPSGAVRGAPPGGRRSAGHPQGDAIAVSTPTGTMRVRAELTKAAKRGTVFMFQSYAGEADVNRIIDRDHLDPYSGFPGYRSVRCKVEGVQAG